MIKVAIITASDKGFNGEREDVTGSVLKDTLEGREYKVEYYKVVPDEIENIERELIYLCDDMKIDLILTNGGTGFSARDVTPEATRNVIKKIVPGFTETMRMKSLQITPKAMLSRAVSGIRNSTLIINLPGSPKGALESLEAILPAIPHGIGILKGEESECAR